MPRKDPMTGCMVITVGEFFAHEAQRNGTTPAQEMEQCFNEIDAMFAEDEKHIREELADPAKALERLLSGIKLMNDGAEPEDIIAEPKAVKDVFDINFGESLRDSSLSFKAVVDDGRILLFSEWSDSGSRWEPPCGETIVEVVGHEIPRKVA